MAKKRRAKPIQMEKSFSLRQTSVELVGGMLAHPFASSTTFPHFPIRATTPFSRRTDTTSHSHHHHHRLAQTYTIYVELGLDKGPCQVRLPDRRTRSNRWWNRSKFTKLECNWTKSNGNRESPELRSFTEKKGNVITIFRNKTLRAHKNKLCSCGADQVVRARHPMVWGVQTLLPDFSVMVRTARGSLTSIRKAAAAGSFHNEKNIFVSSSCLAPNLDTHFPLDAKAITTQAPSDSVCAAGIFIVTERRKRDANRRRSWSTVIEAECEKFNRRQNPMAEFSPPRVWLRFDKSERSTICAFIMSQAERQGSEKKKTVLKASLDCSFCCFHRTWCSLWAGGGACSKCESTVRLFCRLAFKQI